METKQASHSELGFSPDALAERKAELLALLKQTAPELMSDNQLDLERLKELLGEERIAPAEHYELSWAGKTAARREIQKTSSHTLLPDANNPDRAPHMLIEGENLEVLRALQKSYHGKVKMIYIDPPYNTGNDSFVYPDDYSESLDEYQKRTGEKNEAGFLNKQSLWKKNSKESGQYHSAWLSMMYPRLYLARNLLREDGVIFISIDDNEVANLRLACDEIFGGDNFVANLIWQKKFSRANDATYFSTMHDHILCYAKSSRVVDPSVGWVLNLLSRNEEIPTGYANPDNDHRGEWTSVVLSAKSGTESLRYEIKTPSGRKCLPPDGRFWSVSFEKFNELVNDNRIWFGKNGDGTPRLKTFLTEVQSGLRPNTIWFHQEVGHNQEGRQELKKLFDDKALFDGPKPVRLLETMLKIASDDTDCIVMDFFAGSATTAHAVMKLNLDDGANRQCICVQLPELLDEKSEAYKAGYRTIADITRARIDKVIAKLKSEYPDKTADLACAHFTLAPSNFKIWNSDIADSGELRQQLALFQSAEKNPASKPSAQTQTAMLSELLLKHGLGALGVHAVSKSWQVAGVTVHRVLMPDDSVMWLCFEPYSAAFKDEIVKTKPAQVVLLNSCFVGDKADELLANLQLELSGLDIGLTII